MLSRNSPKDFQTLLAGCNAHARRRYVEVANNFREPVRHVLEQLKIIYENDAIAKTENMSMPLRLTFHQRHSGPVMGNRSGGWLHDSCEHGNLRG
ncbi:MAG: transposase [Deltaproteobacteria bacterium]|nr:transposase [Deltaproteobacteria bacterium]